jgi:FkbM family methyltransferase
VRCRRVYTMKSQVQKLLKRAGIYNRVRASYAYELYWSLFDRSIVERIYSEVHFYRNVLAGFRPECLIFDVGANHGFKTDVFLRLGARVVAVEPDPTNQETLREMFLTFRLSPRPVVIVEKALSDKETVTTMWIDQPGSAKNTLSQKWVDTLKGDDERFGCHHDFGQRQTVETTTLDQLIEVYGAPFFVKIDVEGYEPHVLSGLHSVLPYVSFEVNLPEFRPEGLECVEMLQRLSAGGRFNYVAGDYRQGLALPQWLNAQEFSRILIQCTDKSIDVFWRSNSSNGN